jgi:hypothetical protein
MYLTPLFCILEVPDSNLGPKIGYSAVAQKIYFVFLLISLVYFLKLVHAQYLPHYFHYSLSSYY